MKLTIKSLASSTFTVEIEPDKTVKELKEKIEKEQGKDYPSSAQKLIYSGKILADENKLTEYEFDEKKFVVLMITRPPPAPKHAVETTEAKSEASNEKAKQATVSASNPSSATNSSNSAAQSSTTTPSSTETSRPPAQQLQRPPSAARSSTLSDAAALSFGEPQVAARLASLMSQPHFRQIQDMIQQSPHLLSSTIESFAATDPDMYNFISENPDAFVSALNHPPLAGGRRGDTNQASAAASSQQRAPVLPGSGAGRQRPAVHQIEVSEHDKEAIERLKELGFSEYLAVQAYMACDKDEQLAANLLFQMDQ